MGTTLCGVCKNRSVRLSGDTCATCKRSGGNPMDIVRVPAGLERPDIQIEMDDNEPTSILETQLRQARQSQSYVQAILDEPRKVLCVACCESPTAQEQVAVVYALEAQVRLAKVLGAVVPVWERLKLGVKKAVEVMSREEMLEVFVAWFQKLPDNVQRDILQGLTAMYNDGKKLKGGTHG